MIAGLGLGKKTRERRHQDFELNVVPILDCFTILVAFMLVSGAYVTIGALEVSVSIDGEAAADTAPPPDVVTVTVSEDHSIELKVEGAHPSKAVYPALEGVTDTSALSEALTRLKSDLPGVRAVTLVSASEVPYQDVVRVLETTRETHPDVSLGGF